MADFDFQPDAPEELDFRPDEPAAAEAPTEIKEPPTFLGELGAAAKGAGAGFITGAAAPVGLAPKLEQAFAETKKESPVAFGGAERAGQLASYLGLSRLGAKVAPQAVPGASALVPYLAREAPEAVGSAIEAGARTGSLADMLTAAGLSLATPAAIEGVSKVGKAVATKPLPEIVTRTLEKVPLASPITTGVRQAVGRTVQAAPVAAAVGAPVAGLAAAETPEELAASAIDIGRGVTGAARGAFGKLYERQAGPLPARGRRAEAEQLEGIRKPIEEADIGLTEARAGVRREVEEQDIQRALARSKIVDKTTRLEEQRKTAAAEEREAIDAQLASLRRKQDNTDTNAFRKFEDSANGDFIKAVQFQNKVKAQIEALASKPNPLAQRAAAKLAELQAAKEGALRSAQAEIAQLHGEAGGRVTDMASMANLLGVERPKEFDADLRQIYDRRVAFTEPKFTKLREYWEDPEGTLAKIAGERMAKIDAQIENVLKQVSQVGALQPEEVARLEKEALEAGVSKLSDEDHARIAARFGLTLRPDAFAQLRTADLRMKTERPRGQLGGLVLPSKDAQDAIEIEAKRRRLEGKKEGLAPERIEADVAAERGRQFDEQRRREMIESSMRETPSAAQFGLARAERAAGAARPQPVSTLRPPTEEERGLMDVQQAQARRRVEGLSGVVATPGEEAARKFDLSKVSPLQASLGLAAAEGARLDPRLSGKVTGGWLRGILSGSLTDPAQARTFLAQTADRSAYGDPAAAAQIIKAFEAALSRGAKNAATYRDRAIKTNIVRAALEAMRNDAEMRELMAQEMAAPASP